MVSTRYTVCMDSIASQLLGTSGLSATDRMISGVDDLLMRSPSELSGFVKTFAFNRLRD